MALVRIESNANIPDAKMDALRKGLVSAVSAVARENPAGMQVEIYGNRKMRMAGPDEEPLAHVEIRGAEIPKERAGELTSAICPVLADGVGARGERVYIAVVSNRNSMWRVNGEQTAK